MGWYDSKLCFLRTSLRIYSALAIFEPQIHVVVEQFGAENISLLSGRLVQFYEHIRWTSNLNRSWAIRSSLWTMVKWFVFEKHSTFLAISIWRLDEIRFITLQEPSVCRRLRRFTSHSWTQMFIMSPVSGFDELFLDFERRGGVTGFKRNTEILVVKGGGGTFRCQVPFELLVTCNWAPCHHLGKLFFFERSKFFVVE